MTDNKNTNYTPESILALLESGKTPDDLAHSFTEALNNALTLQEKKKKEEAAAAEARRKADAARAKEAELKEKKRAAQVKDTEDLIAYVRSYLEEYYPEVEIDSNLSAEDLIKLIEDFLEVKTSFSKLLNKDWTQMTFPWF